MSLRVLAVDDEPPALDELAYLLRADPRVGEVRTACDAVGALRELEAAAYDVVFLDIRMPGLSGLDLAKVLARFAEPPAVVSSRPTKTPPSTPSRCARSTTCSSHCARSGCPTPSAGCIRSPATGRPPRKTRSPWSSAG